MKTINKIGASILVLSVVAGISFKLYDVKRQKADDNSLVKESKMAIPVTIVRAKQDTIHQDIMYHGTFEPYCEVTISSESQGKVIQFAVQEGDYITEGQTIASLDNDLTRYQLESAEAAYHKAQHDLRRVEKLSPGEAISEQQLDEIQFAVATAKSNYFMLKKQHENSIIKAPVSGTISKRHIEKGSFVAPGSPVADIMDTRRMKFNARFTATDLTHIKKGQKVEITTSLYPDELYHGIIKIIGVKPDNSKRYLVQVEVQNKNSKPLISGIEGKVTLEGLSKKSLVIPRICIVGSIIQPMVYVVENSKVKLRPIVLSAVVNNQAIIHSGITVGEYIVQTGQINLEDNAMVNIQNPSPL